MKRKVDQIKFSQLMKGLAGVFDEKGSLSPIKIELYFRALEDLGIQQIEKSVTELIRNRVYPTMPLPAHIRENIQSTQLLDGLGAWLLVEKCIEGGPIPRDPIINKAVDGMGGYERLGRLDYSELVWTQKEFERRYSLLNERRDIFKLTVPKADHLKIVKENSCEDGT